MPSIVSFNELPNRGASIDIDAVRTYERQFVIRTDTYTTDPMWIFSYLQTVGTVYLYQVYQTTLDTDLQALVNSMTLRPMPNDDVGYVWLLTVPFGPVDPYSHSYNPLLVFPKATFEGVNDTRLCERDYQGSPLLNTAGDNYDPLPEMFTPGCVIRIKQNLASFSPQTIFYFTNKINSDTWMGMDPHTCRIDPPKGGLAYHQTCGQYWETEWCIICRPNIQIDPSSGNPVVIGWDKAIPSRGYRQLVGGNWVKIRNYDGTEIESAAYLNSSGVALIPPVSPTSIVTTVYQIYEDISFAQTFGFSATGSGCLFF